jgi:hypothetical protein
MEEESKQVSLKDERKEEGRNNWNHGRDYPHCLLALMEGWNHKPGIAGGLLKPAKASPDYSKEAGISLLL